MIFVVLAGRMLAYALQPGLSPTGRQLADVTGGPSILAITVAVAAISCGASVAVVWLASLAVSERQRLEPQATSTSKGVSALAITVRAASLFVASSVAFALLESYIHWRAGLGWHGLHCLLGPVHRNAVPILAALSILTAAVLRAAVHVLSWMRRVMQLLRHRPRSASKAPIAHRARVQAAPRRWVRGVRLGARGPPPVSPLFCGRNEPAAHSETRGRKAPMKSSFRPRRLPIVAVVAIGALVVVAGASAHAIMSPPVAKAKALQQFTLSVPTEKDNLTTSKIELTVPSGFAIDSFEPAPAGWKQQVQSTGSGESAVVQKVTWTGGSVPTGEDSVFRFNASTDATKTYTFDVRQTYSDGAVVDWNGPESSDNPAPTVESLSSFGGGGSSTLAIVALAVGILALIVGLVALISGRGRSLA